MKLAIIYYSQTGVNYSMAKKAYETAKEKGAEVRLRKVHESLDTSDVIEGSAWDKLLKETKDIKEATAEDLVWAEEKLVNKYVTAFSSAQNANGGQEQTIRAIYTSAMHWGSIIVPTGYTDDSIYLQGGNPYGVSASQDPEKQDATTTNDVMGAVVHQTKRLLEVAGK